MVTTTRSTIFSLADALCEEGNIAMETGDEARAAERAVPVRVSRSSSGMRIESRGNCAGGHASNILHT